MTASNLLFERLYYYGTSPMLQTELAQLSKTPPFYSFAAAFWRSDSRGKRF